MATVIDGTTGTSIAGASSTQGAFTVGGQLNLVAGTTAIAPLDFTAGTNLTTAIAGAMEYDGKVIYATPQGTQRGVVPGAQFFRLNADLAGANVNTAQNMLGVGVTLSSSTVYAFEIVFSINRTAGATAHTVGLGFGGSATVNNASYYITNFTNASAGAVTTFQVQTSPAANITLGLILTASNTTVTPSISAANESVNMTLKGTVSINAGGTFIPQYTCSAAPGGAFTTQAGSYMMIYPISTSGANTSVGTWA